jgi:hypothetical protein
MPLPGSVRGRGTAVDWARMLAYVTGTVDQELLARNEYLAAENRIIKSQLKGRLKLSDAECQSAFKFAPRSASNVDPFGRRGLVVALAPT